MTSELEESSRQFIDAWSLLARRSARGVVEELDGVTATFSRVAMPLMNMMFVSSPIADAAALRRRVAAAVAYGYASHLPWMLTVCDDWVPAGARVEAPDVFAAAGLAPVSKVTGMVTDALAAPRRPAPALDMRIVEGQAARRAVAELNTDAYGMPREWGHEALDREALFSDDIWGCVAYVDDAPVSTATTALVDGRLYVLLVASDAAQQRKGYAEAVMRRSLEIAAAATGIQRTVLHASKAGLPLYTEMGYRRVARFTMYVQAGHEG